MRIFAISDLHVDYDENMAWVENLSRSDYRQDVLLVAGDISDDLSKVERILGLLKSRFTDVFFVPGNHDLWVRNQQFPNSVEKFNRLLSLCASLEIQTKPLLMDEKNAPVWVVPFHSWYIRPEEGEGSLFMTKKGDKADLTMWSDNYFIKWPEWNGYNTAAEYFLSLNRPAIENEYRAPVISFSHFLPRKELILPSSEEIEMYKDEQHRKFDRYPGFNFSRVAGTAELDGQIREIGAHIHVYGHQHRNRQLVIDDVLYISHCLGYPSEREQGAVTGITDEPKLIWDTGTVNI